MVWSRGGLLLGEVAAPLCLGDLLLLLLLLLGGGVLLSRVGSLPGHVLVYKVLLERMAARRSSHGHAAWTHSARHKVLHVWELCCWVDTGRVLDVGG